MFSLRITADIRMQLYTNIVLNLKTMSLFLGTLLHLLFRNYFALYLGRSMMLLVIKTDNISVVIDGSCMTF